MVLGPVHFPAAFFPADSRRGSPGWKGILWRAGNTKEYGGKKEKCEITFGGMTLQENKQAGSTGIHHG